MMDALAVTQLLAAIEAASARSEKERLLASAVNDSFFQLILKYAYDPYITFGLTPPEVEGSGKIELTSGSNWLPTLLNGLAAREMTGNDALEAVKSTLLALNTHSATLLSRVLRKDLRCGISAKTINKVKPGLIPTFEVMLAHKYEPTRVHAFPAVYEPKLDGVRTSFILSRGVGSFYTRTGRALPALDHLVPAMVERAKGLATFLSSVGLHPAETAALNRCFSGEDGLPELVVDGEVFTGAFNETSGAVRRKDEEMANAQYHIFDLVPLSDFNGAPSQDFTYEHRRKLLELFVRCAPEDPRIRAVARYFANSHDDIEHGFEMFRNMTTARYLSRGDSKVEEELLKTLVDKKSGEPIKMEGIVVKPLNGLYETKRSYNWLKMKAEETDDLLIKGAFEGSGKYVNKLGGLIVEREGVEISVGGGFSDAERDALWQLFQTKPADLIGRMVEVEYHEVTPDGSLRHPRFVRFRDDKHSLAA